MTIIAGSNGSGKSTLTKGAREEFQQASLLDPDAVAKSIRETLPEAGSDIKAGKRVLRLADELLTKRQSFTVETTLSGSTYLRMAAEAKAVGFDLTVIFVGTTAVEINIQRVRARVEKGGHDVPEEDQRRRWPRTLANMQKLLPMADLAVLLDNSGSNGYVLVAFGNKASMHWRETLPKWAVALRNSISQ